MQCLREQNAEQEKGRKERWRGRTVKVVASKYVPTPALILGDRIRRNFLFDLSERLNLSMFRIESFLRDDLLFRERFYEVIDDQILIYWEIEKRKKNPSHLPYLESMADESYAGWEEFEEFYPKSAKGDLPVKDYKKFDDLYYGQNVVWLGEKGKMVRVDPNYAQHIEGNIFDEDKLKSIVSGIEQADERIAFYAPYGTFSKVDLNAVKESIEYAEDEGLDQPLSTGDEDLDAYLVDPETWLEDQGLDPDDPDDKEEYEELKKEMDQALENAVENDEGDLGEYTFTFRDGNHRAFGAMIAGEPYIWMIVEDNFYEDIQNYYPEYKKLLK